MKYFCLLFFLIASSLSAYSKQSYLSCSKALPASFYINGVFNTLTSASETAAGLTAITKRFRVDKNQDDENKMQVKALYNATYLGADLSEAYILKIEEFLLSENVAATRSLTDKIISTFFYLPQKFIKFFESIGLNTENAITFYLSLANPFAYYDEVEMLNAVRPYMANESKTILFAHSEGALFLNKIVRKLNKQNASFQKKLLVGLLFAPASSQLPAPVDSKNRFEYILNDSDVILRSTSLTSNATITSCMDDLCQGDRLKHRMQDIYLNEKVKAVVDGISAPMTTHLVRILKKVIASLPNNDVGCCEKNDGKLWESCDIEEDRECLGGFVADTVEVSKKLKDEDLQVDPSVNVCGKTKLGFDGNLKVVPSKIKLDRGANIIGNTTIGGTVTIKDTRVDAFGESYSSIEGRSSGISMIFGDVTGTFHITGKVTIDDSIIGNYEKTFSHNKRSEDVVEIFAVPNGVTITNQSLVEGNAKINDGVELNHANVIGNTTLENVSVTNSIMTGSNDNGGVLLKKDPTCSEALILKNLTTINGNINLTGCGTIDHSSISGHVKLSGNVQSNNSTLTGLAYQVGIEPMRVIGNGEDGIQFINAANVNGNSYFEGDLLVNGASISGAGVYKGVKQEIASGVSVTSQLSGTGYSGANNFSGPYSVQVGVSDVTIVGGFLERAVDDWVVTTIASSGYAGSGASLTGPMIIEGQVGPGSIIENLVTGAADSIFIASDGIFEGAGKKLKGVAAITASHVGGTNITATQDPSNLALNIGDSQVLNSTIVGRGLILQHSEVDNATINGIGFSIISANLNGTFVYGNAKLCNTTYGAGPYGSGYNCDPDPKVGTKTQELIAFAKKRARDSIILNRATEVTKY